MSEPGGDDMRARNPGPHSGFDIAHVQMFKNPLLASKAPQDIIGQGLLLRRICRIRDLDAQIDGRGSDGAIDDRGISGGMIVPSGITSPVESSSRYSALGVLKPKTSRLGR